MGSRNLKAFITIIIVVAEPSFQFYFSLFPRLLAQYITLEYFSSTIEEKN